VWSQAGKSGVLAAYQGHAASINPTTSKSHHELRIFFGTTGQHSGFCARLSRVANGPTDRALRAAAAPELLTVSTTRCRLKDGTFSEDVRSGRG